jgi:microcystin degradation protein MlrC
VSKTKGKVLVGQTMFEGNSFNPVPTGLEDFEIYRGQELLEHARQVDTMLGGVVRTLEDLGYEVIPAVAAMARPGGPITRELYDAFADELVEAARSGGFDGICLPLHGACISENIDDTEGELLERIRQAVGPDMPISVGLDLHGHITEKMAENATIMTGYRTNPHSDMVETGARAALYLDRVIRGEIQPRCVFVRVPYLTRGSDESTAEPLISLNRAAREWMAQPDILDVSIFNILPFLDADRTGQVVLVYDQGEGAAFDAARSISEELWRVRDEFMENLPTVEAALYEAGRPGKVVVLGDNGDSVVSGTPGDSVEIARVALAMFPHLSVALPVFDPAALQAAVTAGTGARLDLDIGGAYSANLVPLKSLWTVEHIGSSVFENAGSYARGVRNDLGPCAVLTCGNLTVVVTGRAPAVLDPAFYEAVGVRLSTQDAIVAKSANHYKLSFDGIARTITVDTSGLSAFRLHEFPFEKARPIYPLDHIDWNFEGWVTSFPQWTANDPVEAS